MVVQQRCQLTIKPEYGYKHKDCHMKAPKGANTDDVMHFDITLLELHSKSTVRVVGGNEDIYKIIKQRSELWESPRQPYEVALFCPLCQNVPHTLLLITYTTHSNICTVGHRSIWIHVDFIQIREPSGDIWDATLSIEDVRASSLFTTHLLKVIVSSN